jgi:hypothetical protein
VKGFHCFLANPAQPFPSSRRKEKASKNGKTRFLAACGLAFNLSPPYCIVRLKTLYTYKNITEENEHTNIKYAFSL